MDLEIYVKFHMNITIYLNLVANKNQNLNYYCISNFLFRIIFLNSAGLTRLEHSVTAKHRLKNLDF